MVNQTRQSVGLQPLAENSQLDRAAQLKAQNMVQDNYFDHTSPSGISPWYWFSQAGYNYKYAGENLAIGFFDSQEVYDAWLNSPSHKANILNPNYTEVGTAVLSGFGSNNTIVVVQEFGSPQLVRAIAVTKNNIPKTVAVKTPANKITTPVPAKIASGVLNNTTVAVNAKPVPAASTTNIQNPVAPNIGSKVLSQSTESQTYVESSGVKGAKTISSEILSSFANNYNGLLQNIIYGVSMIIIGALLTLIFFSFNINFKRELVFRSVLILVLLFTATLLNKAIILSLIPHQIII